MFDDAPSPAFCQAQKNIPAGGHVPGSPGRSAGAAGLEKLQRRILVYTGGRRMAIEKSIEVWPVEHFLEVLDRGKLW
jgi:hypothetical protein